MTIAVIKTGGKQYKVAQGDILKIELLNDIKEDGKIVFNEVLMIADDKGKEVKLGTPFIKGAKVNAQLVEQGRDKKIKVVKYKAKVRYYKTQGHRQCFMKVRVEKING